MLTLSLRLRLAGVLLSLGVATASPAQTSFVAFESGPVRPLALSPDGTRLLAVNTPDNRLEVFAVSASGLAQIASIPVGMEPVAVAARSNTQVWVVNHLSDSVSIVDLAATPPRVVRTLLVGDEPRDIVFAGPGESQAFITTAHRGQHRSDPSLAFTSGSGDPQLTTAGVSRADVWVFDANFPGNSAVGGLPTAILSFPADTPRALAKSPDGDKVYVAAFHSGNQTTAITETVVCNGFQVSGGSNCGPGAPGGVAGPSTNAFGAQAPEVGVIVKFNGSSWRDSLNRNWSGAVPFSLPDQDVFEIEAAGLLWNQTFAHVGTILFNMVVNPVNQKVYVTNTELPNHLRFEGPGNHGGSTVQGHLSESRITVIDPSSDPAPPVVVNPQHLNQHIDYDKLHTDVPDLVDPTQILHSLATPLQPVVSSDGSTLYVAAFGSAKIGVFSTAEIEDLNFEANFDPTVESASYIPTGGGPSGLALDEVHNRLYVLTRFDNAVRVIDLASKANLATHTLHNPEPASLIAGRPFLYDAALTSGNGEASCSSCHVFGDLDSLAWDLGDPDGAVSSNTQPSATQFIPPATSFHPMKGPMTTQTLRGLATEGAMHWRGDRVDGFFGIDPCNQPTGAPCSEDLSFRNFIVAFEGLVGKDGMITPAQMQQFSDFVLQLTLPPNPVRALDNSLTADQAGAQQFFLTTTSDFIETCNGCHTTDPAQGFFGSGGEQSFEGEPQNAKVPHLRNAYSKVGMFSVPGPQVRGFGFLHDGSIDTIETFLSAPVFQLSQVARERVEQFVLVFPTDLAPIVGQQVTLRSNNASVVNPRIDLLIARAGAVYPSLRFGAGATECDLIVKGSVGGLPRGWVREASGLFRDDTNATTTDAALRALAVSQGPLTYTCAPPGSGTRMGIDRDSDTRLDGLDNCAAMANVGQQNFDGDPLGDACDTDDDNDGLLDSVETNTGVLVSASNTGSNPFDPDSDDDGRPDGLEIANGSDPNDPLSPGPPPVPLLLPGGQLLLAGFLVSAGAAMLRRRRGSPSA